MKNYGFTLMELLTVIAILGILTLIAVPNVIEVYNKGVIKEMQIQETNIKDAANLYLEDYCLSKIDERLICPSTYEDGVYDSNSGKTVEKYVCLNELQKSGDSYLNGEVSYRKQTCKGFVTYYYNEEFGTYDNPKTYLFCGNEEDGYFTDKNIDKNKYCECFDICN